MLSKRLAAAWLATLALVMCMPAHAQIKPAAAEQLMRKSGLWEQLAALGPQVRSGLQAAAEQAGSKMQPDELQRLGRAVDQAFAPAPVQATALRVIAADMTPVHVTPLLAWFDSAVGRKIVALEVAASSSTQDPEAALADGVTLLEKATPERRQLLGRMAELTRASEAAVGLMINTALAIQQGFEAVSPGLPGPSRQEMQAAFDAQRAQMKQAFDGVVLAGFASAYASLSDEELGAYVQLIGTPAGRQFTEVGLRATERAMLDGAQVLGRSMPGTKAGANT